MTETQRQGVNVHGQDVSCSGLVSRDSLRNILTSRRLAESRLKAAENTEKIQEKMHFNPYQLRSPSGSQTQCLACTRYNQYPSLLFLSAAISIHRIRPSERRLGLATTTLGSLPQPWRTSPKRHIYVCFLSCNVRSQHHVKVAIVRHSAPTTLRKRMLDDAMNLQTKI